MSKTISLVQRVRIASPCPVSWDNMLGDDRVRHCSHCNLNVYNLSAMTEREGEKIILAHEGQLCAAIYRRADGTVLTRDCPLGLKAIRRRMVGLGVRIAAMLAFLACAAAYAVNRSLDSDAGPPGFLMTKGIEQDAYSRAVNAMERWMDTHAPPAPPPPLPPYPPVPGRIMLGMMEVRK